MTQPIDPKFLEMANEIVKHSLTYDQEYGQRSKFMEMVMVLIGSPSPSLSSHTKTHHPGASETGEGD